MLIDIVDFFHVFFLDYVKLNYNWQASCMIDQYLWATSWALCAIIGSTTTNIRESKLVLKKYLMFSLYHKLHASESPIKIGIVVLLFKSKSKGIL